MFLHAVTEYINFKQHVREPASLGFDDDANNDDIEGVNNADNLTDTVTAVRLFRRYLRLVSL